MSTEKTEHTETLESAPKSPSIVEKFVIRLPGGLRDQIRELSENNRRSMNSEIIMVLENHIRKSISQEMAQDINDGVDFSSHIAEAQADVELSRKLDALPAEKKEALLELLG